MPVARIGAHLPERGGFSAGEGAGAPSAWGAVCPLGAVAFPVSPLASIAGLLEPVAVLAVGQVGEEDQPCPGPHHPPAPALIPDRQPTPRPVSLYMPAGVQSGPIKPAAKERGADGGCEPTIVLVDGAWPTRLASTRIPRPETQGIGAIGFANPLRGLAGDAAYLAESGDPDRPIVLVGHSYGGNVISSPRPATTGRRRWPRSRLDARGGREPKELLERFEGSLVGRRSGRAVHQPRRERGTDLFLNLRRSVTPSPATSTLRRPRCWPRPSGRTPPPRSWPRRRARRRGRRCRAGICSGPGQAGPPALSGSWPNARRDDRGGGGLRRLVPVPARGRAAADPPGRRGDQPEPLTSAGDDPVSPA